MERAVGKLWYQHGERGCGVRRGRVGRARAASVLEELGSGIDRTWGLIGWEG